MSSFDLVPNVCPGTTHPHPHICGWGHTSWGLGHLSPMRSSKFSATSPESPKPENKAWVIENGEWVQRPIIGEAMLQKILAQIKDLNEKKANPDAN